MSRLTRDGTAEPVSRDQILRHARGQGNIHFPCSADHEQDWQPYPVDPYSAICDDHTYIHTYIHLYIHTYILPAGVEYSTSAQLEGDFQFLQSSSPVFLFFQGCVLLPYCVCFLPIYSGHQVRWTYQPGLHRRKVTQDFSSTFLLRCGP